MKLTCGGGCCPTCWAPDHVVTLDRHSARRLAGRARREVRGYGQSAN